VRIDRLQREYEVQMRWVAFPLHPETPENGLTLEELFSGRNIDIDKARQRLKQVAHELGLPLGERTKTYNSRLAQELAKWAESKSKGDEYHRAIFGAYFVEGRNIGKVDELISIAKSLDLPDKEAKKVLELRTFKKAVDLDWSRCHALGVIAVPTFVLDHEKVVGFSPYEDLEHLLKTKNIRKRT
jgi:predicted DsbA family dithiol-disulfide isomerase